MATFYLVVFLMMPASQGYAKIKLVALKKFLLNGFVKPEELEAAVL